MLSQALAARDAQIGTLQRRLADVAAAGQEAAGTHEGQLEQLVESMGQLRDTCSKQVRLLLRLHWGAACTGKLLAPALVTACARINSRCT